MPYEYLDIMFSLTRKEAVAEWLYRILKRSKAQNCLCPARPDAAVIEFVYY